MRMEPVKHTSLFGLHRKLGARMTQFGGFEMPLNYTGIIEEHLAVRSAAGIFDLSHMGEFDLRGPGALALLEHALTNSAARLADCQAQYTLMCTPDGGTIDDLIVYRLGAERYMLCVNAANIDVDREWLHGLNRDGAELRDLSAETALVAIQGPKAHAILAPITELSLDSIALDSMARFHIASGRVAGIQNCIVARTGYTGEDGFEIFLDAARAEHLFEALIDAGQAEGLRPCGLGARDTLRMEAGLPLYGHELDRTTSPLDAGLATFVRFGRGFVGEEALAAERASRLRKRLVGIRTEDGKSIARQGYKLFHDGGEVGVVTSGTFAPSFNRPLAMAYVSASAGEAAFATGSALEVEIRNRKVAAAIVQLPFYRRERGGSARA
jgi:aminomethyltransferase